MRDRNLAHFNWGTLRAAPNDPLVADFVAGIDMVDRGAKQSAGFVWQHPSERTAACAIGWSLFMHNPNLIASFSVWESPDELWAFVHNTLHGQFLRRAEEWFLPGKGYSYALWWVDPGQRPTIGEARDRVTQLQTEGASEVVFTFKEIGVPAA